MATRNIHLTKATTTFHAADRGLLCTSRGPHTTTRFYIPRVGQVKATILGNATIYLGTTMVLTMTKKLWEEWEDGILSAALGPNWDGNDEEDGK